MDPPTTSLLVQFFARCWRRDCFWQRHDRRAFALDAATGKVLWELPLNSQPAGYTMTYLAGGKQNVAIPAGLV